MYRKTRKQDDGTREEYGNYIVKIRWRGRQCETTTGTEEKMAAQGMESLVHSLRAKGEAAILDALFLDRDIGLNRLHKLVDQHGEDRGVRKAFEEISANQPPRAYEKLIDDFHEWARSEVTDDVAQGYVWHVGSFFEWLAGELARDPTHLDFTTDYVTDYVKWVRDSRYSGPEKGRDWYAKCATANNHRISLSKFGTYLTEKLGLFRRNPVRGVDVHLPSYKDPDPAMTRQEWAVFERHAARVDEEWGVEKMERPYPSLLFWRVLLATGFLVNEEAKQLTVSHFPILKAMPQGVPVKIIGTKNQYRTRVVPVGVDLCEDVHAYAKRLGLGPHEPLFAWGTDLQARVWERVLARCQKEYPSFESYTPGNLRHTFARFYLEAGGKIEGLNRLLGHGPDNMHTTMRYAAYELHRDDPEIFANLNAVVRS